MALLKPNLRHSYPVATEAVGTTITGADGRQWLDGASGAIACSLGHGHPGVVRAIADQLARTSFLYRTQFTSEPAERLAARLCKKLGYAAAFFVNSGSEAVETGVRLALQYWRESGKPEKTKILSRRLSYHGATNMALALSGHWPRRRAAGGNLRDEPTLPTPYCFRCPLGQSPGSCRLACAETVEREITMHGAEHVAALIIEPIVGASGAAIPPPDGYLRRVREICDRNDVLLIADEVLTGLGRTGRWLGIDHGPIRADIVCLGKGLNAGYWPISGVLVDARIGDAMLRGSGICSLGHTHSNHPVAAAAANAVLDALEEEDLVSRADVVGAQLGRQLADLADETGIVGDVRGAGMLWGLELVRDDVTGTPFRPEAVLAQRVVRHAFDLGLVIYPVSGFIDGVAGDAVILAPPLNVQLDDLSAMVQRLAQALHNTGQDLPKIMEEKHA